MNLTSDEQINTYIKVFVRTTFGFLGGETTLNDEMDAPNGYIKNYAAIDLIKGFTSN